MSANLIFCSDQIIKNFDENAQKFNMSSRDDNIIIIQLLRNRVADKVAHVYPVYDRQWLLKINFTCLRIETIITKKEEAIKLINNWKYYKSNDGIRQLAVCTVPFFSLSFFHLHYSRPWITTHIQIDSKLYTMYSWIHFTRMDRLLYI